MKHFFYEREYDKVKMTKYRNIEIWTLHGPSSGQTEPHTHLTFVFASRVHLPATPEGQQSRVEMHYHASTGAHPVTDASHEGNLPSSYRGCSECH